MNRLSGIASGIKSGITLGIKPAWLLGCRVCRVSIAYFPTCAWVRAHEGKPHTTKFINLICTRHTRHTRQPFKNQQLTKKLIVDTMSHIPHNKNSLGLVKKTIRCTPENAKEMAAVVKAWPELHSLVQSLQAQNLFPGLRNLQITITGNADQVAKGLGAILPPNATEPVLSQTTQKDGK